MRIIRDFPPSASGCGFSSAVTLGTFDGVHTGHRHILRKLTEKAAESKLDSVVVTFDRHPAAVLSPTEAPRVIMTLEEKLETLENCGIDIVAVIPFSAETARMDAETFTRTFLLGCLGMKYFIVGYDHGFGKKRDGSGETIQSIAQTYGFALEIEKPYKSHGTVVKSSTIREYIAIGDMACASELLGADYSLAGKVITGRGNGKRLGFPTANIEPSNEEKIIPANGVYSGWIEYNSARYAALINIGGRPTLHIDEPAIEAHILDFGQTIYGETVRLGFSRRLRDIVKFDSEEDLARQIQSDIHSLRQLLPST